MLVYYFVPFIVNNRYLLFWVSNGHNSVTVRNRTHVYMNFFDHKDLGNHLLQLCPKVVKHPVYLTCIFLYFNTCTVHLLLVCIITNKPTGNITAVYITTVSLYIMHTATCFHISLPLSGSSTTVTWWVTQIVKPQLFI